MHSFCRKNHVRKIPLFWGGGLGGGGVPIYFYGRADFSDKGERDNFLWNLEWCRDHYLQKVKFAILYMAPCSQQRAKTKLQMSVLGRLSAPSHCIRNRQRILSQTSIRKEFPQRERLSSHFIRKTIRIR